VISQLKLTIEGFSNLEDHGEKDGKPDIRIANGYKIRLDLNHQRILFEETLERRSVPVNPTQYLTDRIAKILAAYLPQIDPENL
jgi:hypothetical protein